MGAPRRASTALLATTVILGLASLDTASGDFFSNTSKGLAPQLESWGYKARVYCQHVLRVAGQLFCSECSDNLAPIPSVSHIMLLTQIRRARIGFVL